MKSIIQFIYLFCLVCILCLPSLAVSIQMIWDDYFACENSGYSKEGLPTLLVKYLIHQNTCITIVLAVLCGLQIYPETFGTILCVLNFINCMLFWHMCSRCVRQEKCKHSRSWLITLGVMNVMLPILYYLQKNQTKIIETPASSQMIRTPEF